MKTYITKNLYLTNGSPSINFDQYIKHIESIDQFLFQEMKENVFNISEIEKIKSESIRQSLYQNKSEFVTDYITLYIHLLEKRFKIDPNYHPKPRKQSPQGIRPFSPQDAVHFKRYQEPKREHELSEDVTKPLSPSKRLNQTKRCQNQLRKRPSITATHLLKEQDSETPRNTPSSYEKNQAEHLQLMQNKTSASPPTRIICLKAIKTIESVISANSDDTSEKLLKMSNMENMKNHEDPPIKLVIYTSHILLEARKLLKQKMNKNKTIKTMLKIHQLEEFFYGIIKNNPFDLEKIEALKTTLPLIHEKEKIGNFLDLNLNGFIEILKEQLEETQNSIQKPKRQ
jgi:hypothetical protein